MSCSFTLFNNAVLAINQAFNVWLTNPEGEKKAAPLIASLRAEHNVGTVYQLTCWDASEDSNGYDTLEERHLGLFRSEEHARNAGFEYVLKDDRYTSFIESDVDVYDLHYPVNEQNRRKTYVQVVAQDLF